MTDFIVTGDVETTGLEETESALLEIAFVVTDKDLNVVGQASWLWPPSCGDVIPELYASANPKVQKMHTDNGLWNSAYKYSGGLTAEQTVDQILQFMAQIGVSKNNQTELVGRNPNFDLKFLKQYAPEVYNLFSYHIIDICSFQRFIGKTYGKAAEYKYDDGKPHRALTDCLNEINELKYYRDNFMLKV